MARYIDADKLLTRVDCHGTNKFGMLDEDVREFIKAQPAEDVAPVKHAHWIGIEADGYADGSLAYDVWECSECGYEHDGEDNTLTPYCPMCGAKMEVE